VYKFIKHDNRCTSFSALQRFRKQAAGTFADFIDDASLIMPSQLAVGILQPVPSLSALGEEASDSDVVLEPQPKKHKGNEPDINLVMYKKVGQYRTNPVLIARRLGHLKEAHIPVSSQSASTGL
jgi:hypothetical protein